jgi:hypothetical protein
MQYNKLMQSKDGDNGMQAKECMRGEEEKREDGGELKGKKACSRA